MQKRTKLSILRIGTVVNDKPDGWVFDGLDKTAAIEILDAPDEYLYCGYTVDELREIAKKAKQDNP